jgi:hypothetical protein
MILILLLWSTILFATTSENNPKDIVFYSQRGGASLLISGGDFKKTEPDNWISYKNTYIRLLYYRIILPLHNKDFTDMIANNLQKKYLLTERSDDFKTDRWSGIKLRGTIDGEKCSFYIVKQGVYFFVFAIHNNSTNLTFDNIAKKLLDTTIPFSPIIKKEKDKWFVRVVARNICYQFLCSNITGITQDEKDFLIIRNITSSLALIPYRNISVQKMDQFLKHELPDSRHIYTNVTDQRDIAILYSKSHDKIVARIYDNNNILIIEELSGKDSNNMLNYIKMIANTLEFSSISKPSYRKTK